MNNVELNHIRGNSIDGLFLFTNYEDNVYVRATNIILNDLYQFSDRPSSILFWINRKARIEIENIRFSNVGAYNAYLTYQGDECFVNINNIELSNYYSSTASEIFSYSSLAETDGILNISHLRLDNIISQGAIFKSSFGVISVSDSVITNIHTCNRDNSCRNKQGIMELYLNNEIAAINSKSEITIKNTIFDNINGVSGLGAADGTSIYFYNNTIKNSYFKNGIIECDRSKEKSGNITVENSVFINNKSEYGTILNIQLLDERYHTRINIINSKFENNTASKYGGVIYSKDKLTPKSVKVENCEFINNKALIGNDIYTLKIDYEPLISNREYLKNIKGSLATNPTKIKLNNDTFNDLLIKSGDKIPEGITCSIYDDYDNKIMFGSDIANVEISEFMFFKLEVNDTYNSALVGQTRSYCWDNFCEFPIVRVVGNPGVYKLKLIINTFGRFTNFDDNTVDIKIKIIPCENNYLYQDIENIKLKSCYKPSCEPSCNTGTCINNNICSCNNTLFTGSYCNEYIKLKRISVIDISIRIISIILIIVTIITIFSTIYLRNNPIIKGGSVDFLIIILIGLIFSFSHVFFLTVERTTNKCYLIHLLNNIGFSLSYGSILVKTIRIYLIFRIKRRSIGLKKKIMLSIVMTLVIYYIVINLIWYVTGNVSAKSAITEDYKKYQYCSYPDFRVMCIIVNYIVLFLGCYFSYCIRKVKDNFKENLAIPIYAYFIFIGISELANSLYNISVRVQDFFNSTGTIIINSAILLYLYIIKFYTIYSLKKISKQKSSYKNSKSSSQYT
ncbi:hypothetical protein BCR36DRAFT_92865 [Piromyces finnis]|uniref:G-protein coupled receptors family 3 profile domain-containing protein n=1 Tax=Piromyces finnis TaxID=1754191 RepID=A0A1Y1V674_9FUNG|nr:hypothetical protein BCR36DRAFT_92865 [Piromyces finnis]|eukprot:ORX47569.1 hypothetical protein BCR36DRAFT_92865 [Piromyces finnis]